MGGMKEILKKKNEWAQTKHSFLRDGVKLISFSLFRKPGNFRL